MFRECRARLHQWTVENPFAQSQLDSELFHHKGTTLVSLLGNLTFKTAFVF